MGAPLAGFRSAIGEREFAIASGEPAASVPEQEPGAAASTLPRLLLLNVMNEGFSGAVSPPGRRSALRIESIWSGTRGSSRAAG